MRIFASARIAVLDIDPDRRAFLCKALSDLGMLQLLPAASADEARAYAKGAPVDLCLVEADGLTARIADAGSGIPPNPFGAGRTPGILVLANPTRAVLKDAQALGYRLVVPAPVVPRMLYRRIGSVLQKVRRAGRVQSPELAPAPLDLVTEHSRA
jgi:CheY-like chemotaxis protein